MQAPIYHSFDESGYFVGSAAAPLDPVAGGWAVVNEAVATPAPLPEFDVQTQRCRRVNGVWTVEQIPLPEPVSAPEPLPDPVPWSCTRRQGRLALLTLGLLDEAEAAIAGIEDPAERRAGQIEYEAETWERSNLFVQQLWASLGGAPKGLDDAFRLSVTL